MDCFYAAVEMRDKPSLKGKPVIVGGKPDSRGVVATCSYEARRFGIHSAMASAHAYRLCPQAIFVRPNFEKYRLVSGQIREIFKNYSEVIEPLSLDEAYLDVTGHEFFATTIARKIKEDIQASTQLTGSAGVAPNKMLAKIASDMNKPNGLTVVQPHQALSFMKNLPLRKINGIGPATEKTLLKHDLHICSDVWKYPEIELREKLGARMGIWLFQRSRGIDDREVKTKRTRKSLGSEDTFARDILDTELLKTEIHRIATGVANSVAKKNLVGKTITLKVKYADFKQITRSRTLPLHTNSVATIVSIANDLLDKTEVGKRAVRLIGISMSKLQEQQKSPICAIQDH